MHIALDNGGYCSNSRPALWHAPLAAVTINFPCQLGTLGSNTHDYFISTMSITPPSAQHDFTERLTLLPHYHFTEHSTIFPAFTIDPPTMRQGFAGVMFAYLNKPYKMSPDMLTAACGALRRTPRSLLLLSAVQRRNAGGQVARNLRWELEARGSDTTARLRWKERQDDRLKHLAETARADLFLDTIQVNAVWTAFDVLWAGVPLVTVQGQRMASRIAGSVVTSASGLSYVEHSIKAYEDAITELSDVRY